MVAMLLTLSAVPSVAQQASPQCPRDAEPIPAEWAGWTKRAPLATAVSGEGPAVAVGSAYDLTLRPDAELKLPNLPGRVGDRVGHGGTVHVAVASAGTYRVALGSGAWVDLVQDGKALESVGHGHGPACSGIRKIVDFDLKPGRYTITLDGNDSNRTALLIVRKP